MRTNVVPLMLLIGIYLTGGDSHSVIACRGTSESAQQKAEPSQVEQQNEAPGQTDRISSKAVIEFGKQVSLLVGEIRKLRRSTERNSMVLELTLLEERLARLEDKIDTAEARKLDLDANEHNILSRLSNIQQELVLRGGLHREDSEAAIRSELNASLQIVHNQQAKNNRRLTDAQAEVPRLRARIKTLRAALDAAEGGGDKTDDQSRD